MSSVSQNLIPVEKKEQISLSQKLTIHEQHHQLYALKWSEFQSSIVNCFQRLRDEEDFVDVTISCDQRSFAAHRVVLSACSPYFRKLLKSNPCKHPIIILRDVYSEHMECLLSFMYNGEVNIRQDQLQDFLKTAQMLQIRGLTDVSDNYCPPEFKLSEKQPLDNSIVSSKAYKKDSEKDDCNTEYIEKSSNSSKYKLFSDRPITSALMTSFNNNSIIPSLIKETQSAASSLQRETTDPYRNRKTLLTPPPQKRIKSADLFRAQHGINSERALSEAEFPAILQHQISRERRHLFNDCDRAIEANETTIGSSIEEKTALNFQRTDIQSTQEESADDDSKCSSEYPLDRVGTQQETNDSVDNLRPTMTNTFSGIPKSLEQQGLLNKNEFEHPGEISSNLGEKGFSTFLCNRFWNTKFEDNKEIGYKNRFDMSKKLPIDNFVAKSAALSLMVKTACINKQPTYFQEMVSKHDMRSNNTRIQQQKQQEFEILQQFEIQQPLYDYLYELQKSTVNQQKTFDTHFMERTPHISENSSLRDVTVTAHTSSAHILPCPLCAIPLEQRYFRQHLDGHYPRDSSICPVIECGRRFAHPNSVRNHMRIKHTHQWAKMKVMRSSAGHMPSELDLNKKSSQRSVEMRVRATDPRPCPKCGKIYRSAHTLRTHLEDKHTVCPGYRCVLCGTVAKSRNSLHSHMSRQHRGISTKDLPVLPMPCAFDPVLASRLLTKAGVKISPDDLRDHGSPANTTSIRGMGISQEHTTAATLHAAKIVQLNALGHKFDSLSPALTQSHCDLLKESIANDSFDNKRCATAIFSTEPILRQHLASDTSLSDNVPTFSSLVGKEPHSSDFEKNLNENQPTEDAHNLKEKKYHDADNDEHKARNNFNEKELV
ncbi:protein abrupt isoform X3 [Bactrocera dorsalis]|uniref:Protein abrupt isoform X3 n=1 Tax=Bactrocera dorsalis TaxID=27457 RepID=A0ABM3KA75_BACDO|nr:protein abrupt isoform X3 [Bactrocera dorsalis]